jgi:hypothetical protein
MFRFRQTLLCCALFLLNFLSINLLSAQCPSGIRGKVFTDFNFDGLDNETARLPVSGVQIRIYDVSNALVANLVSDGAGDYSFPSATNGAAYRIEFALPASLSSLKPTQHGGTMVQFATAPSCAISLGVANAADYYQANPYVIVPCYVSGNPLSTGGAADSTALVAVPFDQAHGGSHAASQLSVAKAAQVGSIWGGAFMRSRKTIISAAVLKRHSGLGIEGMGGLYFTDFTNPNAPVQTHHFSIPTAGTDPRVTDGTPLPTSVSTPSADVTAFSQVGKSSLGGIALSDDETKLYVVNLETKSLIVVDLTAYKTVGTLPTAANIIGSYPISASVTCTNGTFRPWAVTVYHGKVFVGGVCDASASGATVAADLRGHVLEFTGTGFTSVTSFPLDYSRSYIFSAVASIGNWNGWSDNFNVMLQGFNQLFIYPQPILSEINFDINGDMILGLTDRMGHQGGYRNYKPDVSSTDLINTFSGGDIIRLCKTPSGFSLEGAADCPRPFSEYYWSDYYSYQQTDVAPPGFFVHGEVTSGGLALKPGAGNVVTTLYDPLGDANAGGLTWMNNALGRREKSYQIFTQDQTNNTTNFGYAGKANGLGDPILGGCPAPIEIGNRVWNDCNANGIQDADEKGIAGVEVKLYDIFEDCLLVETKTTDANGLYYFKDLKPNRQYILVFGQTQFSGNTFTVNGVPFTVTTPNAAGSNDENDSDAININESNCITSALGIAFTTGEAGCSNHSFDMGLVGPTLTLTNVAVQNESCNGANDGKITIIATTTGGTLEYSINGGSNWQPSNIFSNLSPQSYNVAIRIVGSGACNAPTQTVRVENGFSIPPPSTTGDEICQFDLTPRAGGLKATCDATCPTGFAARTTWWTAQTGGTQVFIGNTFDPVANGNVTTATVGNTTFWAQCECGASVCVSTRTAAVFKVLPRPQPVLTGKTLVCPSEEATYSTPFNVGNTYVWSITAASGGTIVPTANPNIIKIRWTATPNAGPFRVKVVETNSVGCSNSNEIQVRTRQTLLVCPNNQNIGIDGDCRTTLTVATLLPANTNGASDMKIQLLILGQVVEEGIGSITIDGIGINGQPYNFIGATLQYRIIEPCSSVGCTANITFSDHRAPTIVCPADVTIGCSQIAVGSTPSLAASGSPTVTDCSSLKPLSFSDVSFETACNTPYTTLPAGVNAQIHTLPATGDIMQIIIRTFTATDWYDNISTCEQAIFVRRANLNFVVCPTDFETSCNNATDLTPARTGFPMLDIDGDLTTVYDRAPLATAACRINFSYDDQRIDLCAGSYKLIRTWNLVDWCTGRTRTCQQIIKILDKTPPTVSAVFRQFYVQNFQTTATDTTVNFDGYHIEGQPNVVGTTANVYPLGNATTCGGRVQLTFRAKDLTCTRGQVLVTCSDSRFVPIAPPQYNAAMNETIVVFEANIQNLGDVEVTFSASDACGYALAKKTFAIHTRDNIKPSPVCIEFTRVTLTNTGEATVYAASVNNGSSDNCQLQDVLIRRMTVCDANGNAVQNPDFAFYPSLNFGCCDASDTVLVEMQARDAAGNFNSCMVNILVEDKTKPTCVPPVNLTIACNEYQNLLNYNQYGTPTFFDNCGIRDTTMSVRNTLNNCKVGDIFRKWVVADHSGRRDSCEQRISVQGFSDFTVDFPDDLQVNCLASVKTPAQQRNEMLTNPTNLDGHLVNNGCGVLAVEVTDDTLVAQPDACYKILRKIKVIDWCKYNPNNDITNGNRNCYGLPVCGDIHGNSAWQTTNIPAWQTLTRPNCTNPLERRFRDADGLAADFADGIICFIQVIKVVDNDAPQILSCPTDTLVVRDFSPTGCEGRFNYRLTARDVCQNNTFTNQNLRYNWQLSRSDAPTIILSTGNSDSIYTAVGANRVGGLLLPYGETFELRWMVTDACGNFATCNFKIKVIDAKKPTIICRNVNAELMRGAMPSLSKATVWATDLLASPLTDNCTPPPVLRRNLAVRKVSETTGNYPINPVDSVTFGCDEANRLIEVEIWTKDSFGNADFCRAYVQVQNNMNACSATTLAAIRGAVQTEDRRSLPDVTMRANSGGTLLNSQTNATGAYLIPNVPMNNPLVISGDYNINPRNGVTTYDIALMAGHVVGSAPLTNPYQIIAADVDRDGDVSALDMILTRRLVLSMNQAFPNNTSWRFVDRSYVFQDPTNPLVEPFREVINISNVNVVNDANFIAIKTGDLNKSAVVGLQQNPPTVIRSAKTLLVETPEMDVKNGEIVEIFLKSPNFNAAGFQFTLYTGGGTFLSIEPMTDLKNLSAANFALFNESLTVSWNGAAVPLSAHLFKVKMKANRNGKLSEFLRINSNITTMEAFDVDKNLMNLDFRFTGANPVSATPRFELYQNQPNPFAEKTTIRFDLPADAVAILTISDAAGRILKTINVEGKAGTNAILLENIEFPTGILLYRLQTPTDSATKKLFVK